MIMIDKRIHLLVQESIKENSNELLTMKNSYNDELNQYVYASAIRLINSWKKQVNDSNYKLDFECSLRNYLLIVKEELVIPGYNPTEKFADLGLQMDVSSGKIWAVLTFPAFSNEYHVKKVYMSDYEPSKLNQSHCLMTNSFIRDLTGFEYFKSNEQKLAVMGALRTPNGYSCLVSMSTGGGKSLVTQTISYQEAGLSLVIVPTISLMLDQYHNAKDIVKHNTEDEIFYYHSECNLNDFYRNIEAKKARILFVSPESLVKNQILREKINQANREHYLKNIIIDEAHIIIEWGSSFRIDFQCLDAIRRSFMRENNELRTFLLSATYSDDTIRQLKMFYSNQDRWIEIRCERLRHETRFDIVKCSSYGEKSKKILEAIDLLPRPMIVYVKSPDDAEKLKDKLETIGYHNLHTFTGNTNKVHRKKIIEQWKNNEFDLMIATCAFGVGVDKKDVRTVVHTYVPENPNKYYQEAGRGGRDGLPCLSSMIYVEQDVDDAFSFVSKVITTEKLIGRWFSMLNSSKTQPLLNGKYLIDTYVKPNYNADEEFIDSISNQDVNWNVYVILFLRRNNILSIDEIRYDKGKYIFYVTILERQLLTNNANTRQIINELREQEWKIIEHEFLLMKRNLQRVGKSCWSSMFNKIYRKTDEYCAGCNEHKEIVNFEDSRTLKKNIDCPLSNVDSKLKEFAYGSRCMLILNRTNIMQELYQLEMQKIDVVVADENTIKDLASQKQISNTLLFCNYMDFVELTTANKYFVSGVVVIYVPEDSLLQKRIISIVENNIRKQEIEYILCAKEDYYLNFKNKNLSEVINGPCKQYY